MGFVPSRSQLNRCRRRAFTLPEVVIAGAILALFVAGSVATMAHLNRWASASRLRTLAMALAQQRSDEVLTTPWQTRGIRPTVLTSGTTTEPALSLNNDSFNNATDLSSGFTTLGTPVPATRVTEITDLSPRMVRAVVTVTFNYRDRPYSMTLTTLRAIDDI